MKRLYKFIYDRTYFPFALGRNYPINPYHLYRNLLKSQFYSRDKILDYQNEKINELLRHVKQNNSYYKELIPDKMQYSISDLKEIPVLTKSLLKEKSDKIYNNNQGQKFQHITSGSTGEPLSIITDGYAEAQRVAQRLRFYNWWNIKPSDKNVLIWGQTKDQTTKKDSFIKKIKRRINNKQYFINVFELNRKSVHTFYNEILHFKPVFIRGYKSAIYQLVQLFEQEKLDASKLGIKIAITTSEVLFEEERQYIEKILNTRVADEFGAAEIGLFSYECPKGGRHICEELNYLYTNEKEELLVTDLHNKSMPLINYKIGDKITIDENYCSCGRTSRLIKNIVGRSNADIKKENGEFISQYLFYYAVKELDSLGLKNSILKYKVIQTDLHFDFYIVKGKNFNKKTTKYIENRMRSDIGKNISINFKIVDEIPLDKSGKLRFFKRIK